jgi:hypothetical protein
MAHSGDVLTVGWRIDSFWPEAPGPLIPELLPPDVERVYLQAERNFPIAGNEEAAGTMYRKALYPNSEILTHGAQRCAGMIAL